MKTPSLIQSRFRGVYLGLAAIWLGTSLAAYLILDSWVAPNILLARIHQAESLVRSHQQALQYYDNRALRDELLQAGIISRDQDFAELRPSRANDLADIQLVEKHCQLHSPLSCVGPEKTHILSDPIGQTSLSIRDIDHASFVVALSTQYFHHIIGLTLWKLLSLLGIGSVLALVGIAIRKQEEFLLKKMDLLTSSLSKVESYFKTDRSHLANASKIDEFSLLSKSIEQAGSLLEAKTAEIEIYRKNFEKKTRIEQLAQTISYTSHDLKAPLCEGVSFLHNLPDFIESMPRDRLIRSIRSLEARLESGVASLDQALKSTRESQLTPENIGLITFLMDFQKRIETNPSLREVRVQVDTHSLTGSAQVYFNSEEMTAAFWNLVQNSIEARRNCHIQISAKTDGEEAVIHFVDNGPGIPESALAHIFDDFYTTKPKGSGLGLASVKRTIERARGRIRALSSDIGATFEIRLRLAQEHGGANVQA